MSALPNPFLISALEPARAAETAAAPGLTDPPVAAADCFDARFSLDHDRFLADIEAAPAFLSDPRPEYLSATDMMPVLEVLAGY